MSYPKKENKKTLVRSDNSLTAGNTIEEILAEIKYTQNEDYDSEASTVILTDSDISDDPDIPQILSYTKSKVPYKLDVIYDPNSSEIDLYKHFKIKLTDIWNELLKHNSDARHAVNIINGLNKLYNSNGRVISYLVGGIPRDILLYAYHTPKFPIKEFLKYVNDFDIVVFNISISDLGKWLTKNGYVFDKNTNLINKGNFLMTNCKVDVSTGNRLSFRHVFKHIYATRLCDNIKGRDSNLNSGLIDLRSGSPRMYDPCNGTFQKDAKNRLFQTQMDNLTYIYKFRSSFFFRLIKYVVKLSMRFKKEFTIDAHIWEKVEAIKTHHPVPLSNGWSHKLSSSFTDSEFIKFMNIMKDKPSLKKFVRDKNWDMWINRASKLDSSFKDLNKVRVITATPYIPPTITYENFPELGSSSK